MASMLRILELVRQSLSEGINKLKALGSRKRQGEGLLYTWSRLAEPPTMWPSIGRLMGRIAVMNNEFNCTHSMKRQGILGNNPFFNWLFP